jgi:hypothetical protein
MAGIDNRPRRHPLPPLLTPQASQIRGRATALFRWRIGPLALPEVLGWGWTEPDLVVPRRGGGMAATFFRYGWLGAGAAVALALAGGYAGWPAGQSLTPHASAVLVSAQSPASVRPGLPPAAGRFPRSLIHWRGGSSRRMRRRSGGCWKQWMPTRSRLRWGCGWPPGCRRRVVAVGGKAVRGTVPGTHDASRVSSVRSGTGRCSLPGAG